MALPETENFRFRSGCRKERTLVRQTFHIPIRRTHRVGSSTIIRDIDAMRKAGLASLAFFYCDFREDQKRDLRGLLSSLLVQLCHQSDSYSNILCNFYSEHANGLRHPSDDALAGCLKDLLELPGHAPVYLVVDALDECLNTTFHPIAPRQRVLNLIEWLIKSRNSSSARYASPVDQKQTSRIFSILWFSILFPCMTKADKIETSKSTSSQ